ncbi:transcriptional regulator, partial [Streptomyces sp. SID7803]|nr:transcriptional regulator [Streptomyces sp. SID7803]
MPDNEPLDDHSATAAELDFLHIDARA